VRWALLLLAVTACGASLEILPKTDDAAIDPPPDAAVIEVDAPGPRPCSGGQAAMTATDGSCVVFFSTPQNFDNAKAQCAANNSTLAILNSAERDAAAKALIGTLNVFIGLTDAPPGTEGTFTWVDGTPLAFDNFAAGEPNNANGSFQEDCVMYNGTKGAWDDRPCSNAIPGIGATPGEYPFLCMF
jgi:hypothetical protein